MTRTRADDDGTPNALMATYYTQRASAGLIVTECTQISEQGHGIINAPGIHNEKQVEGWSGSRVRFTRPAVVFSFRSGIAAVHRIPRSGTAAFPSRRRLWRPRASSSHPKGACHFRFRGSWS